jgi:hypothetical protein
MKRKKKPGYYTLLATAILFLLGAVLTVMPMSYAYKECLLGYKAHCTLAPISTTMCAGISGIIFVLTNRYLTETQ